MVNIIWSSFFSWLYLLQLVINKATGLMVALGLKIAVFDLSLILLIKLELTCRCFAPLSNSKIYSDRCFLWTINRKKHYMSLLERKSEKEEHFYSNFKITGLTVDFTGSCSWMFLKNGVWKVSQKNICDSFSFWKSCKTKFQVFLYFCEMSLCLNVPLLRFIIAQ